MVRHVTAGLAGTVVLAMLVCMVGPAHGDAPVPHARTVELSLRPLTRRAHVPPPVKIVHRDVKPANRVVDDTPWLPAGVPLTLSVIDGMRWGAALERWNMGEHTRRQSMTTDLEQIRAHYGSYKRAMRVLAHEDVP